LIELQAPSAPAHIRRSAARNLLELSQRHREATTLEKRLVAVEQLALNPTANSVTPLRIHNDLPPPTPSVPTEAGSAEATLLTKQPARRKRKVHAVLHALACGTTVAQAALKAGVSERTVYRRLAEASFRRELETLQAEIAQRAADLLLAASMQA